MNPIVLPIVGINNLTPAKKKSLPGSRSQTKVVWCATRLRRYRMSYIEVVIKEKEQLLILIRRKETSWICCADLFMEIKMAEWLIWFLGVVIAMKSSMDDFRSIRQQHPKFKQFKHENHNATQEERRTLTLENQKVTVYFSVYHYFLIFRPKKKLISRD